jgi:hypothetical protein
MEQFKNIIIEIICIIPRLITNRINELLVEFVHKIGDIDLNDSQIEQKITLLLIKFTRDFGRDIGKFIRSVLNDFPPFDIVLNIQKLIKIMLTLNKYNELFKNINDENFMDKLNNVNLDEPQPTKEGIVNNITELLKSNVMEFSELIMNTFIQKLLNTIGKIPKPEIQEEGFFSKMLICKEIYTSVETENTINVINNIGQDKIELLKTIINKSLSTIMSEFANSFYNAIIDTDKIQKGGYLLKKLKKSKNEILTRINKDLNDFKNTNKQRKYTKSRKHNIGKRSRRNKLKL